MSCHQTTSKVAGQASSSHYGIAVSIDSGMDGALYSQNLFAITSELDHLCSVDPPTRKLDLGSLLSVLQYVGTNMNGKGLDLVPHDQGRCLTCHDLASSRFKSSSTTVVHVTMIDHHYSLGRVYAKNQKPSRVSF